MQTNSRHSIEDKGQENFDGIVLYLIMIIQKMRKLYVFYEL